MNTYFKTNLAFLFFIISLSTTVKAQEFPMDKIFIAMPEDWDDLSIEIRKILLKDSSYRPSNNVEECAIEYWLHDLDKRKGKLISEMYFTTGQSAFGYGELKCFWKADSNIIIIASQMKGGRFIHNCSVNIFEYDSKENKVIPSKILLPDIDQSLFICPLTPDSILLEIGRILQSGVRCSKRALN